MTIEENQIYKMDCLEGLKLIPDKSIDLIVTDPPYLIKGIHEYKGNELGKQIINYQKPLMEQKLTDGYDMTILDEMYKTFGSSGSTKLEKIKGRLAIMTKSFCLYHELDIPEELKDMVAEVEEKLAAKEESDNDTLIEEENTLSKENAEVASEVNVTETTDEQNTENVDAEDDAIGTPETDDNDNVEDADENNAAFEDSTEETECENSADETSNEEENDASFENAEN